MLRLENLYIPGGAATLKSTESPYTDLSPHFTILYCHPTAVYVRFCLQGPSSFQTQFTILASIVVVVVVVILLKMETTDDRRGRELVVDTLFH